MKSAYELAMERLGGEQPLSDAQKEALAEVDRRYDAKSAEVRLAYDQKIRNGLAPGDAEDQAREELARDLARIEEQREAAKNDIRAQS